MQYRKMPKSEDSLSVLGYGCMRFRKKSGKSGGIFSSFDEELAKEQVMYAIENGVNYLDTAWPYHAGASESFLGEHILSDKAVRKKVYIATKLPCMMIYRKEKIEDIFEKQLQKLKVDYIDYYLMHSLDGPTWERMKRLDIVAFLEKIKREKKVRHVGFSFHGSHDEFIKISDDYGWDFVQVQFNILDENFQAGIKGINHAAKKNMGVIVMEPLRGGSLVGEIPKEVKELYDGAPVKRSPADWALSWILSNPDITLVLSGMNETEHIKENIEIADKSRPGMLSGAELEIINRVRDKYLELMQVGCTGCGYCMPCPAGINIPDAFKYLNSYHMFKNGKSRLDYALYAGAKTEDGKPHWTTSCIDCGKCEKACPQNIEVRKEFEKVRRHMENAGARLFAAFARPLVGTKKR